MLTRSFKKLVASMLWYLSSCWRTDVYIMTPLRSWITCSMQDRRWYRDADNACQVYRLEIVQIYSRYARITLLWSVDVMMLRVLTHSRCPYVWGQIYRIRRMDLHVRANDSNFYWNVLNLCWNLCWVYVKIDTVPGIVNVTFIAVLIIVSAQLTVNGCLVWTIS